MKLTGLSVLITGGSGDIGLEFASSLLQLGNRVLICGRSEEKLIAAKGRLPAVDIYPCDINNKQAVDKLLNYVSQHFGKLNVLINNAGIQNRLLLSDEIDQRDVIAEEITTNLTSQIQLTHRVLPLLAQDRAMIVNITSALAVVPKRSAPVYCAAKAGLRIFTRSLRYQLSNTNTRVFEVVPALVDTNMTKHRPDKGKISPGQLVRESLKGIKKNKPSIYVEKTRLLMAIYRIFPSLAYRILQNA